MGKESSLLRVFLCVIAAMLLAGGMAHADDEPIAAKLVTWQHLLDTDSHASFAEISEFIRDNPGWPEQKKLRIRAEQSLRDSAVSSEEIISWFSADVPLTGIGKIALAQALMEDASPPEGRITTLIREAWVGGDFDPSQEKDILSKYSGLIRPQDDIARIDRLLWDEKLSDARSMLPRVPAAHQHLFNARIALIENKKNAGALLSQVDKKLQSDVGLIYDRLRYRARRGDDAGVRDMLLKAPAAVPYPEKWWRYRGPQVRKAIDEGKYGVAEKLLERHGQVDGAALAEANWLMGWIRLEFLKKPKEAYSAFYHMYDNVRMPVSRARAAYWAARAAAKSGDNDAAANWYNTAASFPTTFYGQLASLKHFGTAPLRITAEPSVSSSERERFENSDVVRAARFLIETGEMDLANKFITHLIETAPSWETALMAAQLGKSAGQEYLSVRGSKKAQTSSLIMLSTGYPAPKTPEGIPIERPLALAIMRQESEFDPRAKSPAGALGMMQLLPGTARETAKKIDMGYSRDRLFEPSYNMEIGSAYLSRLLDSYDNSYIMAIAAYNAGPGNVRNWSAQFGTPGSTVDGAVNWIEKIPFVETRNYVQRVLENLQIYRHIESDGDAPTLQLGDDLVR